MTRSVAAEPRADCPLCPRLVIYREENARREPDWFNGAVPSFGDEGARLLIVGLAPGRTGANRTARPFTGDWAGDLLYATLDQFGFSKGTYRADPADGLELVDAMITNAVRCAPPQNKPVWRRDGELPAIPRGAHRRAAQSQSDDCAGADCARERAARAGPAARRRSSLPTARSMLSKAPNKAPSP